MHMSDCLGGYDFWDENHENELDEPRFIERGKVTKETFSNTSSQILEINSKTGLYPLYVTYSIYRAKCKDYNDDELTKELKKELWNDTIQNNVFVICKTPMAKQITQRTLAGYSNIKINAHYFDDLINQIENKSKDFVDKVLRVSYWKKEGIGKMKFDAVVGNPPYQEEGSNTRKSPLYHYFYDVSFKLSNVVSLISPARFLFDAGQTPKNWNEKMLNDEHFKVIKYFSDSKTVFDTVDIKGGVVVTLRNANEDFGKIRIFKPYNELDSIIIKIENIEGTAYNSISDIVSSRGNYRFTKVFLDLNPSISKKLGKGTGDMIVSNVFDKLPEIFTKTKIKTTDYKFLGRSKNERVYRYISNDAVQENPYLNTYNVVLPKSNGTGAFGETLSAPMICGIHEGATDTFISIGLFQTNVEANAMLKYLKTKFLRTMLSVKKVTQDNPKSVWQYIPIQNFTNKSDIDWSKSISEIDKQLYKKYRLSNEEIQFIEKKIKSMG